MWVWPTPAVVVGEGALQAWPPAASSEGFSRAHKKALYCIAGEIRDQGKE